MPNRQYEKACVIAATLETRFEIEHKLKQFDEIIAQAEATVARLYEERREFVNRHNLNKCKHEWVLQVCADIHQPDFAMCRKCGEHAEIGTVELMKWGK